MLLEPIFAKAAESPDENWIFDESGSYTARQLAAMVAGLGAYVRSATARPNVGLLMPSSAGFVASFYGILAAGKSVVPLNFLLGEKETAHVIRDSGIDTIITIPQLAGRLANLPLKVIDLTQILKAASSAGPQAGMPRLPSPRPDDMAVLMYTSGTSGLPKGVILTYQNLLSDVLACIEAAALERKHTFLGIIPLFHAFGMTAMMLAPIQLGSPVVYTARFSAVATVEAMRKHKASIIFGVPSMFAALLHLKNASAEDFSHIYAIISGGEPLPSAVRQAFPARFNVPVYEGYGLTETSPVIALNTPQTHRAGSVGKPLPTVDVRIVDDEGNALGAEQSGELWLRGPMIMKGYYNLPAETAHVLMPDGFLRTGDLAKVDADGFLYITGRKKDLVIVAGEKVVPREVEEVLTAHPTVAEAAVVGRKDPARGEIVVAYVVANEGKTVSAEELRAFCRQQGLVPFKVPREVVVLPQLPRSPTGKVLKRMLAEN